MLEEIRIPPKLETVLRQNSTLHGSVLLTFAEFGPWIQSSGTPFFPEYTDHGVRHIAQVLQTASSLIRDEAWPIFTASDAALLSLAVLLHDSALHLTEDGFLSLIQNTRPAPVLPGDKAWSDMWAEFLSLASRFDGRTLITLFGSSEPIHRPGDDPAKWEFGDRLLIGEFLRRNHTQLTRLLITGYPDRLQTN